MTPAMHPLALTAPSPVRAPLIPSAISPAMIATLAWYRIAPARRPPGTAKKSTHMALLGRALIDRVGGVLTTLGKQEWRKHHVPRRKRGPQRRRKHGGAK